MQLNQEINNDSQQTSEINEEASNKNMSENTSDENDVNEIHSIKWQIKLIQT